MLVSAPQDSRQFKTEKLTCDLAVAGGGMAGVCCAITAARAGAKVVLVQDRPVLGGNASSEVRLWVLGATAHMGNNNRWAREGGVLDEILVENLWRNPEGNPVIFDTVVLEKVVEEPNITLLLNTVVIETGKSEPDRIGSLRAFCSQNSTMYEVRAKLFCDASGDGVLGFLAGAAFRMGAESKEEFGEALAPDQAFGELLGHTIYFYSKDTGKPVTFVPPSFALADITKIPKFAQFNAKSQGCGLWWIEWGGRMDTVHDTEKIKWDLWKVVYGVWNHIKNSGQFPEAANLTLEWVGLIPGKRESRRFEGPYMLRQQDVIGQKVFDDAVSFTGWSIDLHPSDGVYMPKDWHSSRHWHARGVAQVPYRCMYSRNIKNLFVTGRLVSVSHVAFGTTRVMATCAHNGQAAGMAAATCVREGLLPAELSSGERVKQLQRELLRAGQFIPGVPLSDGDDLARQAKLVATSRLKLSEIPDDGPAVPLKAPMGMLLPLGAGKAGKYSFVVDAEKGTELTIELRTSNRPDNYTPDVLLASRTVKVAAGERQVVAADFSAVTIDQPRYCVVALAKNEDVHVHTSHQRITGVLSVANFWNQTYPKETGVESFAFWLPARRPEGRNLAMKFEPALDVFGPENLVNGFARPTSGANAWLADPTDALPAVTLQWDNPRTVSRIELSFDADFDHPLESAQWGHPERAVPFCMKHYRILDTAGSVVAECTDNHQTRNTIRLSNPVTTDRLVLELVESWGGAKGLFEIRCYET